MARHSLSDLSLEVTPHVHGVGMHLCFAFARVSSTLRGQVGYISVSLTHMRPGECSVLRLCEQPREIPVLLPLVVHSLIRQTFKAVFEYPSRSFGGPCNLLTLLGACHSGEGSLLTRLGLGLGRCLEGLNRVRGWRNLPWAVDV